MPSFRDHFAFAAGSYASHRPRYPDALFAWLASITPNRQRAWDCATGSGQAASSLAAHFEHIVATDPSLAQLDAADRTGDVDYAAMTAEAPALSSQSVDLITVAQALHWFDRPAFFAEVDRVLRPGAALVVWSYGLLTVDPEVDAHLARLYLEVLGPYWPPERALVESGYAGIALPYPELAPPAFVMKTRWNLEQLAGYVSTWSAVGRYRAEVGRDPIPAFLRAVEVAWRPPEIRPIRWPLIVRAGCKPL
jgi:SAM-dependent methyltransferase